MYHGYTRVWKVSHGGYIASLPCYPGVYGGYSFPTMLHGVGMVDIYASLPCYPGGIYGCT